jgi:hypothetical protein
MRRWVWPVFEGRRKAGQSQCRSSIFNRFTVLGAVASLVLLVAWLFHWHKSGPQR